MTRKYRMTHTHTRFLSHALSALNVVTSLDTAGPHRLVPDGRVQTVTERACVGGHDIVSRTRPAEVELPVCHSVVTASLHLHRMPRWAGIHIHGSPRSTGCPCLHGYA